MIASSKEYERSLEHDLLVYVNSITRRYIRYNLNPGSFEKHASYDHYSTGRDRQEAIERDQWMKKMFERLRDFESGINSPAGKKKTNPIGGTKVESDAYYKLADSYMYDFNSKALDALNAREKQTDDMAEHVSALNTFTNEMLHALVATIDGKRVIDNNLHTLIKMQQAIALGLHQSLEAGQLGIMPPGAHQQQNRALGTLTEQPLQQLKLPF